MIRFWPALGVALFLAGGRLVADFIAPPILRWWFTPVVAVMTSLLTSLWWAIAINPTRDRGRDVDA